MKQAKGLVASFLTIFLSTRLWAFIPTFPPLPPILSLQPEQQTRLIVTYKPPTPDSEKENLISKFGAEKLKRLSIVNSDVLVKLIYQSFYH